MSIALTAGYPGKICNNFEKNRPLFEEEQVGGWLKMSFYPPQQGINTLQIHGSERCRQLRESK